jgi:hypothetical protein
LSRATSPDYPANGTMIDGGEQDVAYGMAMGAAIGSGGLQVVGGFASTVGTTISGGGVQDIQNAGHSNDDR